MEYRVTIYCKELCGSAFGATDWVQKKNIDLKKNHDFRLQTQ